MRFESLQKKVMEVAPGTLFFIPSPEDPQAFDKLLNDIKEDSFFIFFEKEESLATKNTNLFRRFTTNSERFFWLWHDTEEEFCSLSNRVPWNKIKRVVLLPISSSWMLHRSCYRTLLRRIEEELQVYWRNRITSLHMGHLWVRHIFRHLGENFSRFRLWPQWGHDPILVAGAGTSLETILQSLPQYRPRLRILAVDTALSCFFAAGITPDAAVCLEAQQVNVKDFQNFLHSGLPLFLDLTAHPSSARFLDGPVYPFASTFAKVELVKRLENLGIPLIPSLGSVGVAAVFLAFQLTKGPIFFVGLDFAFPSGKTHAKETPFHREILKKTTRFCSVEIPDIWHNGGLIQKGGSLTTPVFLGYAKMLTHLFIQEKHRCFSVCQCESFPMVKQKSLKQTLSQTSAIQTKPDATNHRGLTLASIIDFFNEEEQRLNNFFDALEKINQPLATSSDQEKLLKDVRFLEHLYFFYPDIEPQPRIDSSFLSRLLLTARWHQNLLKRLKNDLPMSS